MRFPAPTIVVLQNASHLSETSLLTRTAQIFGTIRKGVLSLPPTLSTPERHFSKTDFTWWLDW